jgi:hypothetical protein
VIEHEFKISDLESLTPLDHFVLRAKSNRSEQGSQAEYVYLEKNELMRFLKSLAEELQLKEKHVQLVESRQVQFFDNLEDKKDERVFERISEAGKRGDSLEREVERLGEKKEELEVMNRRLKEEMRELEERVRIREDEVWKRELRVKEISVAVKELILRKGEQENEERGNAEGKGMAEKQSKRLQTLIVEFLRIPKKLNKKHVKLLLELANVSKKLYEELAKLAKTDILEVIKPEKTFGKYFEALKALKPEKKKVRRSGVEEKKTYASIMMKGRETKNLR